MTRRGNCYAAAEALYHILGGKKAGWKPMVIPRAWPRNDSHWFLQREPYPRCPRELVQILDPSRLQFTHEPPYHLARGCGFLTKRPSRKARDLMRRLTWQEVK